MPISISKGFAANRSANMANLNFSVTEPLLSELGLVFHYGLEIYNDFLQTAKNEIFTSRAAAWSSGTKVNGVGGVK